MVFDTRVDLLFQIDHDAIGINVNKQNIEYIQRYMHAIGHASMQCSLVISICI